MKKFDNIVSWITIVFLGVAGILWPFWLANGYLNEWYPLVGSFIAVYGGLIANIIYLYKSKKK